MTAGHDICQRMLDSNELACDQKPLRICRAAEVYGTPRFAEMRDKCIGQELSWERPAVKWEAVLGELFFGAESAAAAPQQQPRPSPAEAKASVTTPVQVSTVLICLEFELSRLIGMQSVYRPGGGRHPSAAGAFWLPSQSGAQAFLRSHTCTR